MNMIRLVDDFDAHLAGGAGDDFDRAVHVDGVELAAIFSVAISSSCLRVILPTFSTCGLPLPFLMPILSRIASSTGWPRLFRVKVRSS